MKKLLDNVAVSVLVLSITGFLLANVALLFSLNVHFGIGAVLCILSAAWIVHRKGGII